MNIKKLFNLIKLKTSPNAKLKQAPPATFKEELHRWCNTIAIPISLLSIFAWPIYITLDTDLYPYATIVPYLRWGLTAVGFISLALYFTPYFKKRAYWLIYMIIGYVTTTTGIILGLVAANPVYMGGFSIVVLGIALLPLQRIHGLLLLLSSLSIFLLIGTQYNMKFVLSEEAYGLYNLVVSVGITLLSIYVFDLIRLNSYRNSRATWIANAELKKANELKNQLLQIAAHDLKDPLQVIILYTHMLKERLSADRFVAEKLKIVHRSTDRMIQLIAGLLEITDIESGKLVMHRSEIDLGKVVDAAVKSYQPDSQKKNQKLLYTGIDACMIEGDEMLLRQVANHLISNAIKFSPPGKSIWVTVERQNHGSSAALKVRDEGPGLEKDEIARVFDKFQQLSTKPTGNEISTGLGLAITKDLVTLHEGSIAVESEPGKGSTFTVILPMTAQTLTDGE
jgi:signal transduction histidine kinase